MKEEPMAQAKTNDTVKVHYTGTLADGTTFDSSSGRNPLEFTIGKGMVIPGFENCVIGMNVGDSKKVSIPADEAYGSYQEELVAVVERTQIPPEIELEIGMILQIRSPDDGITRVVVKKITEKDVTLDLNHPLAGQNLTFELKLIEVL